MPSHRPVDGRGPHDRCQYPFTRSKPWKARVKKDGREMFLGWFATKEEAEAAERWWRS